VITGKALISFALYPEMTTNNYKALRLTTHLGVVYGGSSPF